MGNPKMHNDLHRFTHNKSSYFITDSTYIQACFLQSTAKMPSCFQRGIGFSILNGMHRKR